MVCFLAWRICERNKTRQSKTAEILIKYLPYTSRESDRCANLLSARNENLTSSPSV